jgi:Na+/alanine symporter
MEKFVSTLNDIVWNPGLVGLLLVAGLYFSVRTRFLQVCPKALKSLKDYEQSLKIKK